MVKKLLLILSVVSSAQVLAQPPESAPQTVLAVGTAAPQHSAVEPRQPRLRFKSSGPTCMCADGLTEKDIAARQQQATASDHQR